MLHKSTSVPARLEEASRRPDLLLSARQCVLIEDFPLQVCQVESVPNLLSAGAFVGEMDVLFGLSLLILFAHNGFPESTGSIDAGLEPGQGQGFHLSLPAPLPACSPVSGFLPLSGLPKQGAGAGPGAHCGFLGAGAHPTFANQGMALPFHGENEGLWLSSVLLVCFESS